VSDPEGSGPFESERSTLASMGSRRVWFFRAPRKDEAAPSKRAAPSKNGDGPFVFHSMLGSLASRSGPEPEPEPARSSLLALEGPAEPPPDTEPVVAPLTAHSTLAELAGLEEHSSFAFPIERAILVSLGAHLLLVILLLVAPGRTAAPQGNLIDVMAAAMQTPKDDTPIPAFFTEAPGAPRPNPNRSPLSDADRRAGGGDPSRPKADLPYVPRSRGIEGLAPGPRAPQVAGGPAAAPKGGKEAAAAENRAALERKDPSAESKPSEFPSDMRPQLGGEPREVTKLAGLDAAIREAARGSIGGEGGAPFSNEDGGFVDLGGVSFETSWYDWGPYAAEMLRRIKLHWKISRDLIFLQQRGNVRVAFSIMADGSVADVKVLQPSTIPPYTHAAMKAILESDPFRPLPKDLLKLVPGKDRERIVIHFIYFPTPEEMDGRRDGDGG
jgi:TonB family protein